MNYKNSKGIAMIEVLVAVVILAIGLLASSRMQILGINYTVGASTRTQATMAANDIIDRMRLNRTALIAGAYDGRRSDDGTANPGCSTDPLGCNAANLANTDIAEWTASYFGTAARTSTQLPPGSLGVISAPDPQGVRTVTITWQDSIEGDVERDNNNNAVPQFVAVQVVL